MSFTENEEILKPLIDPVFKALFTSETKESREALKGLLSAFLDMDIKSISINQNEPAPIGIHDKQVRFDIACKLDTGSLVNVEMSMNSRVMNEKMRIEYYLSKLLTSQDMRGKSYEEISPAYQVSILKNRILFQGEKFVNKFEYIEKENHFSFGGITQIITVELDKIEQMVRENLIDFDTLTEKEKWSIFFIYANQNKKRQLINRIFEESEEINMAGKALSNLSKDEKTRLKAIQYEKRTYDYDRDMRGMRLEGIREGIEQGIQRGVQEVAKKLKESGNLSLIEIAKITGLNEEEIDKL